MSSKKNIIKAIKMNASFYIPWRDGKIRWCAGAYEGTDFVDLTKEEDAIFRKVMAIPLKIYLDRLEEILG